jgi:hypothetical protein
MRKTKAAKKMATVNKANLQAVDRLEPMLGGRELSFAECSVTSDASASCCIIGILSSSRIIFLSDSAPAGVLLI